jgi:hypothetical protein
MSMEQNSGADRLGHWTSIDVHYNAGNIPVILCFKSYAGIAAVVFGQVGLSVLSFVLIVLLIN